MVESVWNPTSVCNHLGVHMVWNLGVLGYRELSPSLAVMGYCTFELNRCTRDRAAYISTFRYTNLMYFLDCVQSFSIRM